MLAMTIFYDTHAHLDFPDFEPDLEQVIARAILRPGQRVLDLGTGTGSVAIRAASLVAPGGQILGVDLSSEMLAVAERQAKVEAINDRILAENAELKLGFRATIDLEEGLGSVVEWRNRDKQPALDEVA